MPSLIEELEILGRQWALSKTGKQTPLKLKALKALMSQSTQSSQPPPQAPCSIISSATSCSTASSKSQRDLCRPRRRPSRRYWKDDPANGVLIVYSSDSTVEVGQLPKYRGLTARRRDQETMSRRVEIINAVSTIRENYRQARLIVWEIARREHSIEVLASKGHFRLRGHELELDKELFGGIEEMDRPTVAEVRVRDLSDDPLKQIREVIANQKWLQADGAYLYSEFASVIANRTAANAKRAFSLADRKFRERVIVPLKKSMALREKTDYLVIRADFISLHQEVMQICTTLRGTFDDLKKAYEAALKCRKLLEGVANQEGKIYSILKRYPQADEFLSAKGDEVERIKKERIVY
ncbi:hypothetical protein E6O75_ATG03796 [Venturia nashicola]|uniref:Uncharacterized protein n=1 Tax=Venturia nashicola TaxID=86259 RepID=A0A4Z1P9N0_9PEZI|nr:hypothetical protein E6O75_ATG03796 [Venturia nashicola]